MTSKIFDNLARAALAAFAICVFLAIGSVGPRARPDQAPGGTERPYPHGDYKADCSLCHKADSWSPALVSPLFKHADSGFPLEGAHQGAPCRACHQALDFSRTPRDCASCHQDVHGDELGPDCARCHTTRNFIDRPSDVGQHRGTRFPLTGAHVTLDCDACHAPEPQGKLVFVNTPIECISCHRAQWDATTNPVHAQSGFSTDCSRCHTTTAFIPAIFDHAASGFPLTGAHASVPCARCHPDNQYTGIPTDCVACHQADYNATTSPGHAAVGFSTNCKACHSTKSFTPAHYDHSATGFPLTGAHKTTACTDCHINNQYPGTPTDCYSCHQANYEGTTDPNHVASGFPTDCAVCHSTGSWQDAKFDHSKTAFPLTGAHKTTACTDCHINNQYPGTPTDCYACHQANYNGTTDPNHVAAGFQTDCKACHSTSTWQGATFDHSKTLFPLTGAHKTTACTDCHINNQYAGTPTDCYACHQAAYNGTTDPNHVAAGFPTDCKVCHSTGSWQGAKFDHSKTAFPLTGSHTTAACTDCHINNQYAGTPTDCYACHQAAYNGTTNPNHAAAGFSTDCKQCHNTTSFQDARFTQHDPLYFPIYSGRHRGTWNACTDCHTNPSNYSDFSCFLCHAKGETDSHHREVRNYSYDSQACYRCHPRGTAGD